MKKIYSFLTFVLILGFGIVILGFQETEEPTKLTRQERLDNAVAEKLNQRRKDRMKNCRSEALKIAEERVDSMLMARAKMMTSDTITKPVKATKPEQPEIIEAKDSTPIEPLFEEVPDTIQ